MNTLEELKEAVGTEKANMLLMEHLMASLSKAMKYDEIADALDNKDCTADDIRRILANEGDMD